MLVSLWPTPGHQIGIIITTSQLAIDWDPLLTLVLLELPLATTFCLPVLHTATSILGSFLVPREPPLTRLTTMIVSPCQGQDFETRPNPWCGRDRRWGCCYSWLRFSHFSIIFRLVATRLRWASRPSSVPCPPLLIGTNNDPWLSTISIFRQSACC